VISKPDQLKKKATKSRKRTVTDLFVETLAHIESQQNEQQTLLEKLILKTERLPNAFVDNVHSEMNNDNNNNNTEINYPKNVNNQLNTTIKSNNSVADQIAIEMTPQDEFEKEFSSLLISYMAISEQERSEKIRKVIYGVQPQDNEQIKELLDLLWTEGLQKELRRDTRSTALKPCNPTDCSYKKELEKIEEFYKEFLSNSYLNSNVGMPAYLSY